MTDLSFSRNSLAAVLRSKDNSREAMTLSG